MTTPSKVSLNGVPDYATANALLASRVQNAGVPYVSSTAGALGGPFWVCLTVSLDLKGTWAHNIFENSRFARFAVTVVGPYVEGVGGKFEVELFSGGHKADFSKKAFRKFRVASLEEAADRVALWALANR